MTPKDAACPTEAQGCEPLGGGQAAPYLVAGGRGAPGGCSAHEAGCCGSAGAYHGGEMAGKPAVDRRSESRELRSSSLVAALLEVSNHVGWRRGLVTETQRPALPLRHLTLCLSRDGLVPPSRRLREQMKVSLACQRKKIRSLVLSAAGLGSVRSESAKRGRKALFWTTWALGGRKDSRSHGINCEPNSLLASVAEGRGLLHRLQAIDEGPRGARVRRERRKTGVESRVPAYRLFRLT